ncbi:unnamed protein product [Polarella glacialis]|uniref:RNA helicase n=1 Tax=Polarella glacialis TaxID=89957 RepID=A0A813LII5_POLGL|nr:unnamed protein product [Polarella glacialis]
MDGSCPDATDGYSWLKQGAQVLVCGLQAAGHHNGSVGTVASESANDLGRWQVEVKRCLALKAENLELKVSPFGVVLQKGARVVVRGLESTPQFNSIPGTIVSDRRPGPPDRWEVELRSTLSLKPENLVSAPADTKEPARAIPKLGGRLRHGISARITGLKSSPEFNGLWATVKSHTAGADGRWQVDLLYRRESKLLSLRCENLIPEMKSEPMRQQDWASDDDAEQDGEAKDRPGEANRDNEDAAGHVLPKVNHANVQYDTVQTSVYKEHPDVSTLGEQDVQQLRESLCLHVGGEEVARPICSWAHLRLPQSIIDMLAKQDFSKPTAVQCQALPCALLGRDVLGITGTGTGKTFAYLIPMIVHAMNQNPVNKKDGPLGIVLCPTRELAVQVHAETCRLIQKLPLRSVALVGGMPKQEQCAKLHNGVELVVANPGRLIDLVRKEVTNLRRVTILALDEVDRLLDRQFEAAVLSVAQAVRPDRQMLLFSATMPQKGRLRVDELLRRPIVVTSTRSKASASEATGSTEEHVLVLEEPARWAWLASKITGLLADSQLVIFVNTRASCEGLAARLRSELGLEVAVLHGDLEQSQRLAELRRLRLGEARLLLATDVAARGLDVPSIRAVISFEVSRDAETHVHRVGRTGRAGSTGQSYSVVAPSDRRGALMLARHLHSRGLAVPEELRQASSGVAGRCGRDPDRDRHVKQART